jgi:hypothetical protein
MEREMPDELVPVLMSATCWTEGCLVEGVTYDVPMYPPFLAQCAQCGQAPAVVPTA